jgi:hypothetical protein
MSYSSLGQLVFHREESRYNGVEFCRGGEISVFNPSLVGMIQTAEWLRLDTSPKNLRLFIKSTRYTMESDIIGQINFPRNIIHG